MNEKYLILRCQEGEKEAFEELIIKYNPYVYGFLLKSTANKELSEDLTQEVFLKIIRNIEKFDVNGKASFSTYLITVARNTYIDYLRRYKNIFLDLPIEDAEIISDYSVEDRVMKNFEEEIAMDKLRQLTEEQQIVIKLKYLEGMTLKEIGEKLNLEPKTIKSRIHNGMIKLRTLFKEGNGHG